MPIERKYKWRRDNYQENTRGLLMVHTGNGKGKTTCALGLMMRAAGQELNCCMIQFMKSRNDRYGEHISAEKLGIEVHTMGDGFTWDTKNPEQDRQTARATWDVCVEKLRSGDYDLLVFDELVYVLSYGPTVLLVTNRQLSEKTFVIYTPLEDTLDVTYLWPSFGKYLHLWCPAAYDEKGKRIFKRATME